jgi:replicative DNA helicase
MRILHDCSEKEIQENPFLLEEREGKLWIDDKYSKIGDVLSAMSSKQADVHILDHLHNMTSDKKHRVEQLEEITRCIKLFALHNRRTVILLSQLNRDATKGGEPYLHHLRGSGSIEQDADIVTMLYEPSRRGEDTESVAKHLERGGPSYGLTDRVWYIRKNRYGKCGESILAFDESRVKFSPKA